MTPYGLLIILDNGLSRLRNNQWIVNDTLRPRERFLPLISVMLHFDLSKKQVWPVLEPPQLRPQAHKRGEVGQHE
jgi:hypothetical protein